MTCKQLVECLEPYLAGEVAVGVRENLESHLEVCANCRRYFASYQSTVRLAALAAKHADDLPSAEVPEELVQAILSARGRAKH
jgi:anti-sigma factor RsiW